MVQLAVQICRDIYYYAISISFALFREHHISTAFSMHVFTNSPSLKSFEATAMSLTKKKWLFLHNQTFMLHHASFTGYFWYPWFENHCSQLYRKEVRYPPGVRAEADKRSMIQLHIRPQTLVLTLQEVFCAPDSHSAVISTGGQILPITAEIKARHISTVALKENKWQKLKQATV